MKEKNPFNVKSGQIWEDCDPRMNKRKILVLNVREDYGYAVVKTPIGRLRRVRLDRFRERSNGYKLVSEFSNERP